MARAALDGRLDAGTLAAADPDEAMAGLRALPGLGPFYRALIQVRSTGVTDVLPTNDPRVLACAGELYGLDGPMSQSEFEARAQAWRTKPTALAADRIAVEVVLAVLNESRRRLPRK